MQSTGSPNAYDILTNPNLPVVGINDVVGLLPTLAYVTGGVRSYLSVGSSRLNFPLAAPTDNATLPTTGSQTTFFCKRVTIPTTNAILRMGPIKNTAYTVSGAVTPKIKYQLYTIGSDGRPADKVTGISGTCVLNGGTNICAGVCASASALPYAGDYIIAWVYNGFAVSVTANGTWLSTDRLYLGTTGGGTDGFWSDGWTERGCFKITVSSMFADSAAFDAFTFPASIATLVPSAYTEEPNGPAAGTIDWFWTYQR